MLNKSIGSLHIVPAPSAAVLGESLKLLATFGDKKDIGKLLEQMREVQANNEQVFRDAQAAIGELTVMRNGLEEERKSFTVAKEREAAALGHRSQELSQAEARLSGEKAKFAEERKTIMSELAGRNSVLMDRDQTVSEREAKCDEEERDLGSRLAMLDNKESALRAKEQQLQARENKLRALLEG